MVIPLVAGSHISGWGAVPTRGDQGHLVVFLEGVFWSVWNRVFHMFNMCFLCLASLLFFDLQSCHQMSLLVSLNHKKVNHHYFIIVAIWTCPHFQTYPNHIYIYIYMHACTHTYIHRYIIYIYICMYVCIRAYEYTLCIYKFPIYY